MAVHAQYPSNALFLNRNLQDSDKTNLFSIQAQKEEACPDQIHSSHMMMIFNTNENQNATHNNNGINQRKRGRDTYSTLTTAPIDSFSTFLLQSHQQQQQQPQMLDISQFHHPSQNLLVSTGLKLSNSPNHLHHHHQQQHQINQNNDPIRSSLSDHTNQQMKQQRHEIDQLLHFQGEQLQRMLSDKQQRQYRLLLTAADESLKRRLIEKQSEIEKIVRRNAELEARAEQLSMESQLWQAKARAQESTVASLQSQLHQALMNGGRRIGDETEQQQQQHVNQVDDAESVYIDPDRVVVAEMQSRFGPICKGCRRRPANIVMMPCRHLSVCTVCDGAVAACPYCFTMKDSSLEVFFP